MNTEYTWRVTIPAPPAHTYEANQLALCLGESASDDHTFTAINAQDPHGNQYALVSTVVKEKFLDGAETQLVAPDFAPNVDLAAAREAQALLRIGTLEHPVQATPNILAVIKGDRLQSAHDHIAALGLTLIPQQDDAK
ncbi:hypothetical protein [Halomonas sp. GD1P12]|uniref:hypothetical protein n=1 Tax=Halomonas sp. GD1P12 TaxID=2982691 RepID=UPI0021E3B5D1|nr:hypothetical protein [Halomonas sp. GD1P12]UYF99329.1 hypothetical protein OCT39_13990 [Halomonas sp. GD1P12]